MGGVRWLLRSEWLCFCAVHEVRVAALLRCPRGDGDMASQLRNRHLSRPTVLALALGLGGERWDGRGTLADEIGVAVLLR